MASAARPSRAASAWAYCSGVNVGPVVIVVGMVLNFFNATVGGAGLALPPIELDLAGEDVGRESVPGVVAIDEGRRPYLSDPEGGWSRAATPTPMSANIVPRTCAVTFTQPGGICRRAPVSGAADAAATCSGVGAGSVVIVVIVVMNFFLSRGLGERPQGARPLREATSIYTPGVLRTTR